MIDIIREHKLITGATSRVSLCAEIMKFIRGLALLVLALQNLPLRAQTITPVTLDGNSGGDVGKYTAQAIVNGCPAISYFDQSDANLKYVRALNASGTSWGAPVTVDSIGNVGQYTSLAVVNGHPAISYFDDTTDDLKYVRANDVNGATWGIPLTLDSTGSVGPYTSLAVIDGNPAISYHDGTNYDLKYVRALDESGTIWGTPATVDSSGLSVGLYTSLAVVNGRPAIGYVRGTYFDATFEQFIYGDLRYVRASDAIGASWGAPVIVDSGEGAQSPSLAVVNGNPAISYCADKPDDLKYVRASDANGAIWDTPLTLDSTGLVGLDTSLAVVEGNPAISYYDGTKGDLKYIRASDASGANWPSPASVASPGNVGQFTSLRVVSGNPAVSYYDSTNGDLKWVTIPPLLPGIAVTQRVALSDGVSSVAFGKVSLGSGSEALTFSIANPGYADLTGLAVNKDGTNPEDFSVSPLSSTSIPVGSRPATFTVTFSPTSEGTRRAAIHVTSNVTGAKNPFDIMLTGEGLTSLQTWKLANLGDANAADDGNPDDDAYKNLAEYGLVQSPTAFSSGPVGERFTYPEGDRLRIFFTRDPARNDVTIEVLAADELPGPWTPIASSTLGAMTTGVGYYAGDSAGPGLKTVEVRDLYNMDDPAHLCRFLRLRISR